MPRVTTPTGIELEYESIGSPNDPVVLLVMGFTAQLITWPDEFCEKIAAAGRHVIRFDNRDCGLSTKLDGIELDMNLLVGALLANDSTLVAGKVPYTLSEMAGDAIGLLDALNIDQAHIVGASMGGMIVQTMAIEHAHRVASLTSIMSTTGEGEVGKPSDEAMAALLGAPALDRESHIEQSTKAMVFMSKRYADAEKVRERAAKSYDRSFYPEGATRQMGAIVASGSRADHLPLVSAPTLVIHGLDDCLIDPSGGRRTAELIPGATLLLVEDMGHDMPDPLLGSLIDAIVAHTAR